MAVSPGKMNWRSLSMLCTNMLTRVPGR